MLKTPGPGNVAAVIVNSNFDPNHPNFTPGPGVFNISTFDATGNFAATLPLTLPSQIVNGQPVPLTVGVEVVDRAGNASAQTLSFVFQGPNTGSWQSEGPGPISTTGAGLDYATVSGRITAIAVDPRDQTGNTIFVGSANGGVWKTVDGGADWTPLMDNLTDANGNPVPAPISALAIAPAAPDVIYAGTGVADHAYDSRPGVGLYKSIDDGKTWNQVGVSGGVDTFAGARITKIAISRPDELGVTRVYVAVAGGGQFGAGLYRSGDGGVTWVNVLDPNKMTLTSGGTLGSQGVTHVTSVTDVAIDFLVHEDHDIYVGIGNIGFIDPASGNAGNSAGVWTSPNDGGTWFLLQGGLHLSNSAIPIGTAVGKVTIALPETRVSDDGIIYALISNPTPFGSTGDAGTTQGSAIADAEGQTGVAGLWKTKVHGDDWTHVMLRQSVPVAPPVAAADPHHFINLNLTADEASYVGTLVVDPTNANVVYIGGARLRASITSAFKDQALRSDPQRGLLRVDTSNMRDTDYVKPDGTIPNDGDDINKARAAGDELIPSQRTYPGGGAYNGEGVFWQDLEQDSSGDSNVDKTLLPPIIHALVFDTQGRLLIGTDGGLWRGVNYGFGYDFSSSPGAILHGVPVAGSSATGHMQLTSLNGNLEISDQTSVAIDRLDPNKLFSAAASTGWAVTTGGLIWTTLGELRSDALGQFTQALVVKLLDFAPGTVRVGPIDPSTGQPEAVYLTSGLITTPQVRQSLQGGAPGTFFNVDLGLRDTDLVAGFPGLAVGPNKVFIASPTDPNSGSFQDELIFGSQRVYRSENSADSWTELTDVLAGGDVITAAAIAATGEHVFYVGTRSGKVYVTLNNGGDGFPNRSTGLPQTSRINGITIDPNNEKIAYVTIGSSGGHVFRTTDGGMSWTDIDGTGTGRLPNVPAYALALDDRALPGQAQGRLYVGTEVGVYTSVDLGQTWTRLGQGLPHVPVLDIQFSPQFEKLAVATLGRGTFEISTDRLGPQVVSVSPTTPIAPGLSTITIAFSEPVDARTFTVASIHSLVGPAGPITPLAVTDIDPVHHEIYQITFASQTADGIYTLTFGPDVADLAGNLMNQNNNLTNGETPGDEFTVQFVINTNDNGRFVGGTYHDLLNRSSDTNGFINFDSPLETARLQQLQNDALIFTSSTEARRDFIYNGNVIAGIHPQPTGLYQTLLHRAASDSEITLWVNMLNHGARPEDVIQAITASQEYFIKAGGVDPSFVNRLFLDLLGTAPDAATLNQALQSLSHDEEDFRHIITDALDHSPEYRTALIASYYAKYLRPASQQEIDNWLAEFNNGLTAENLIAILVGSDEYFNSPAHGGGTNETWVTAVYHDILGRDPDPSGQAAFLAQLNAGASRSTVALEMLSSDEYRRILIQSYFTKYLGRVPSEGDFNVFLQTFQQGATDETVLSIIVGSAEYFQRQMGSAVTLADQDVNWINAAYVQVLGRSQAPSLDETAGFRDSLTAGEGQARSKVSGSLVNSDAYRRAVINQTYVAFLGRPAGEGDFNVWLPLLQQPTVPANSPNALEQFQAGVLGSGEYLVRQRDPSAANLATNQQWVISLYRNVLGRDPNNVSNIGQSEANVHLNAILSGYEPQRLAVSTAQVSSNEYQTIFINAIFTTYLRRKPSAAEVATGLQQLAQGMTDEQLINNLVSSDEYYLNPTLGNGNNSTWLNQAYLDILGRGIGGDTGAQGFLNALNGGSMTRSQILTAILSSPEYRSRLIAEFYNTYLGRTPAPPELQGWLAAVNSSVTDEQVIAAILASPEYFQHQLAPTRVGGNYP
jgi:hypothetical protein